MSQWAGLPSDKQELLRKSSTERLCLKLAQIGWDEENVLALDRTELLEAAAEVTLGTEQLSAAAKENLPMDGVVLSLARLLVLLG